jgi:hypothetical protein
MSAIFMQNVPFSSFSETVACNKEPKYKWNNFFYKLMTIFQPDIIPDSVNYSLQEGTVSSCSAFSYLSLR